MKPSASWQRWEWLWKAIGKAPGGFTVRCWLRWVFLQIVRADRILTTPIRLPSGSRAGALGE